MPDCKTCIHYESKNDSSWFDKCYTCGLLQKHYEPKEDKPLMTFRTAWEANEHLAKKYNKPVKYNEIPKARLEIKDVIFNPPATIIMWNDSTKTVVKTQNGEAYDPEKGLAMAYLKKALGNKGNYFNQVKKWTQPYWDREKEIHEWAMRVIYGAAANMFRENEEAMAKKEEADT